MTESHTLIKEKKNVHTNHLESSFLAYTDLNFSEINRIAKSFAKHIEDNTEVIVDMLLNYESFEVAEDEIGRTLDLLTHLDENEAYFKIRIGPVAAFLPRNQPLYALTCFVLVPSLMASEAHFRIPRSMSEFFPKLLTVLDAKKFFPNIYPSTEEHNPFLRRLSALRVNPKTGEAVPVTDAVVFTGTPTRADQLRSVFDSRTLFITNGSGHNPVIISEDADIEKAVEAVLCVQLYNQGQDCAAPNAILVHKKVFDKVLESIHIKLPTYKVGHYTDRSCKIGPISDPFDLVRIQEFLIKNRENLDPKTPGIIRAHDSIVEPTIILKPLKDGANFVEMFAPIIFIQIYEDDKELATFFDDINYAKNAMYVTVYGTSNYVKTLIGKKVNGKLLHNASTILFNTHLHVKGVERGTQPYGGYGYGASNLWFRGHGISKPTLPQRDIFEQVVGQIMEHGTVEKYREDHLKFTELEEKNIEKLLRLSSPAVIRAELEKENVAPTYLDLNVLPKDSQNRYWKIDHAATSQLLTKPDVQYVSDLAPGTIKHIAKLRELLKNKPSNQEDFKTNLYAIVGEHEDQAERQTQQKIFFGHLYRLLFGKSSGPKLTIFLWEVSYEDIAHLLDM